VRPKQLVGRYSVWSRNIILVSTVICTIVSKVSLRVSPTQHHDVLISNKVRRENLSRTSKEWKCNILGQWHWVSFDLMSSTSGKSSLNECRSLRGLLRPQKYFPITIRLWCWAGNESVAISSTGNRTCVFIFSLVLNNDLIEGYPWNCWSLVTFMVWDN